MVCGYAESTFYGYPDSLSVQSLIRLTMDTGCHCVKLYNLTLGTLDTRYAQRMMRFDCDELHGPVALQ